MRFGEDVRCAKNTELMDSISTIARQDIRGVSQLITMLSGIRSASKFGTIKEMIAWKKRVFVALCAPASGIMVENAEEKFASVLTMTNAMSRKPVIDHCLKAMCRKMTELLERINRHLEFLMDCAIEQSSVRASTQKLIDEIESVIRKPKSNAEKIRQMNDEELVVQLEAFICHKVKECRREDISCTDCALKWLKQEVKTDDER